MADSFAHFQEPIQNQSLARCHSKTVKSVQKHNSICLQRYGIIGRILIKSNRELSIKYVKFWDIYFLRYYFLHAVSYVCNIKLKDILRRLYSQARIGKLLWYKNCKAALRNLGNWAQVWKIFCETLTKEPVM